MFVMIAPGLLSFSIFFGFVGLFIGMSAFVFGASIGLVLGISGLVAGRLKTRRYVALDRSGVMVQAGHLQRERTGVQIWGASPVRIVCIGEEPEPYRGMRFRSDWFVDAQGSFEEMPDRLTVVVAPERPERYHVDLRPFEIKREFGWRALWLPALIMVVGLVSIVSGTLSVGEGPQALRPPTVQGTVTASGHALGNGPFAHLPASQAHRLAFRVFRFSMPTSPNSS